MKLRGVLCLLLLLSASGFGQVGHPEVDTLFQKALHFNLKNQDSTIYYAEKAYDTALAQDDPLLIGGSIYLYTFYLIAQNKHDEARELLQYNVKHEKEFPNVLNGNTYYNLGNTYYLQEKQDQALEKYLIALQYYELAENRKGLASTNLQLTIIYQRLGKKEISDYFAAASLRNSKNAAKAHQNQDMFSDSLRTRDITIANKMIADLDKTSNFKVKAILHYNLGKHYLKVEDWSKAIKSFSSSLKLKNERGFTNNVDKTHVYLAEAFLKLKQPKQAQKNLVLAKSTTEKRQQLFIIEELLSQSYEMEGNYKTALYHSEQSKKIKDSLNRLLENDRIAEITAQFETEKQATQIELLTADNKLTETKLSNQKNILIATILGALLLMTALYFGYNRYKTKQKLQFSEMTRKLLQMQLNPHFLFNALNGIQNFIKLNDTARSSRYISNFSGLMRNILENSVEKFISIEEDADTISDFLALQQLVNNNSFNYKVTIDDAIDPENMCIPPMFTQPFVENAIIHGVQGLQDGMITVDYTVKGDTIEVRIADNGRGILEKSANANSLHKSMGTSITKQRMENLLKTENYPVTLEVISKNEDNDEQETLVILNFLKKYL